mgnify:CR=1 FL=1
MERNNQNGSYCITEQGDLGLGTTPISKDYVDENGKISIPKNATEFGKLKEKNMKKKIRDLEF